MTLNFKIAKCTGGVTLRANCDCNLDERRLKREAPSQKEKTFLYIPANGGEICDLEVTNDSEPGENFSLPLRERQIKICDRKENAIAGNSLDT